MSNPTVNRATADIAAIGAEKDRMRQRFIVSALGCFDSDGGNIIETKGTATFLYEKRIANAEDPIKIQSVSDYCKSDRILYEFDCNKYVQYPKDPNDLVTIVRCPEDTICSNGACLKGCTDSDGGLNFTTLGRVEGNTVDGQVFYQDSCISDRVIAEGSCNRLNSYATQQVNCCDFGMTCQAGKCDFPAPGQENLCATEPTDLCPQVEGIQQEYLFDVNGDGRNESCVPVRDNVCQEPNPALAYPDATLYDHAGSLHLGFCIEGESSKVMHIICDQNGGWQSDITECENQLPCVRGKCDRCLDTDGGNSPVIGTTTAIKLDNTIENGTDSCNGRTKHEYICQDGALVSILRECSGTDRCAEIWRDGQAQIDCIPPVDNMSCLDSDGGIDYDRIGTTSGIAPDGTPYQTSDGCSHTSETPVSTSMIEFYCDGNLKALDLRDCPANKHCVETDQNGARSIRCVDNDPRESCADSDGGENFNVFGQLSVILADGSSANIPDGCFGPTMLREYRCDGKTYEDSFQRCPPDQVCRLYNDLNGDPQLGCTPGCIKLGDDRNDIYESGIVYDSANNSSPDFCEGNTLRQFSCGQNGEVQSMNPEVCPNGCRAGACIR